MFYFVLLNCRPSISTTLPPFITVKFVDAQSEDEAGRIAVDRTKELMVEKGFPPEQIDSYAFAVKEIKQIDREEADFNVKRSFGFYLDG